MTVQLPNKLSDLLLLAVKDAKACEAMPDVYTLDMRDWHVPPECSDNDDAVTCSVCLAGSVMAQTLKAPPTDDVIPSRYDAATCVALMAVDQMRTGMFVPAADSLCVLLSDADRMAARRARDLVQRRFDQEHEGRADWATYEQAAAILAEAGL